MPGPDTDLDLTTFDVDAVYHFNPSSRFVPYVLAGVGYASADLDRPLVGTVSGVGPVRIDDDNGFTLNAAGIDLWAVDQLGHGLSPGTRGDFGTLADSSALAEALTATVEHERPGLPLIAAVGAPYLSGSVIVTCVPPPGEPVSANVCRSGYISSSRRHVAPRPIPMRWPDNGSDGGPAPSSETVSVSASRSMSNSRA